MSRPILVFQIQLKQLLSFIFRWSNLMPGPFLPNTRLFSKIRDVYLLLDSSCYTTPWWVPRWWKGRDINTNSEHSPSSSVFILTTILHVYSKGEEIIIVYCKRKLRDFNDEERRRYTNRVKKKKWSIFIPHETNKTNIHESMPWSSIHDDSSNLMPIFDPEKLNNYSILFIFSWNKEAALLTPRFSSTHYVDDYFETNSFRLRFVSISNERMGCSVINIVNPVWCVSLTDSHVSCMKCCISFQLTSSVSIS